MGSKLAQVAADRKGPGSNRVSGVGLGVPPKPLPRRGFGGTPNPARGTRALPGPTEAHAPQRCTSSERRKPPTENVEEPLWVSERSAVQQVAADSRFPFPISDLILALAVKARANGGGHGGGGGEEVGPEEGGEAFEPWGRVGDESGIIHFEDGDA